MEIDELRYLTLFNSHLHGIHSHNIAKFSFLLLRTVS